MPAEIERRVFLKFLFTSGIVLTSTGSISSLLAGCEKGKERKFESVYDFLAHLEEARIIAPGKEHVKRTSLTIGGDRQKVLFAYLPSQVTFHEVPVYENARLVFGIGIDESVWKKDGDGVLFEILLDDEQSQPHTLYSRYIDPKNNPDDRRWFDEEVDLTTFEGKNVSFIFKTSSGPKENCESNWAGWSKPRVVAKVRKKIISTTKKLNVILITADTLRADYLKCYGKKNIITHNLDKLAQQGVLFQNCFCQSTTTNPSHASILTSLYPKDHQVYYNTDYLSEETIRISDVMQEHGIHTFAIVSAPHLNPDVSGFGKGFDTFIPCSEVPAAAAGLTNKQVFHWLRRNHKNHFFMWIHYFDPHAPYAPPDGYRKMYYSGNPRDLRNKTMKAILYPEGWIKDGYVDWLKGVTDIHYPVAQYMGEISYLDEQVGRLVKEIYKYGLESNTIIIFTADHGESLGDHNIYYDHAGLYEPTLRVPLIIWYPPKFTHKVIGASVMSVDIMPTILETYGFHVPQGIRGKSLLPCVYEREKEIHDAIFCEHVGATQAMVRNRKWKYIKSLNSMPYTPKFSVTKGNRELYALDADPKELKNVMDDYPKIAEELDLHLAAWLKDKRAIAKPAKKPEVSEELKEKLHALGYAR